MKQRFAIAAALTALTAGLLLAQASRTGEVQLKAAQHKEEVEGDLKGAIEQYKRIAQGSDRALVAKALLRMAECYTKLGDAEARKIYERVVREYADQKEAVTTARARLGGTNSATSAKGDRAVWTGPNVDLFGTISPDGRFLTYVDWITTGNLMLRDLAAGTDRSLTQNVSYGQFGQASWSAISRDGKYVAYEWLTGPTGKKRRELRLMALATAGSPESREILNLDDEHVGAIHPFDWSPDGAWLAVSVHRKDSTGQIGLVAVRDGKMRTLKSTDWRGAGKIVFSPDGRYIAYDLPASDTSDYRNLFIMATDGSQETTAVAHASRNAVMGWLSDEQKHLLFASDRTGTTSLWAVPVAEGKAQSSPKLVKSGIGSSISLGVTAAGALSVYKPAESAYIQVASIDLNTGKLAIAPGSFQRFIGSGGRPSWSADGKYLAYQSCAPETPCTLAIASHDTGQVREVRPKMRYLGSPRWSHDGRSLITDGSDLKARRGLYRIDAESGDVSPFLPRPGEIPQWDRDEKKSYYRHEGGIFEFDAASGHKREVFRRRAEGNGISIVVSPDGRSIAAVEYGVNVRTLLIVPIAGGELRELWKVEGKESFDGFRLVWTPDSRAVLLIKQVSGRKELWHVSLTGNPPRKLDADVANWVIAGGGFSLHPDGRHIAFVAAAGKLGPEVWMLENILSSLGPKQ